jgi:predicted ArsR family transcriptional regulator
MGEHSTRERLIEYIHERGASTVSDLQRQTGLSRSALRGHLARLTRAGLVSTTYDRRSTGRPPRLYRLKIRSDLVPPETYHALVQELFMAMRAWGRESVEALFQKVATRVAAAHPEIRRLPEVSTRLDAARRLLFGGDSSAVKGTETGCQFSISTCPLAPMSMEFCDLCSVARMVLSAWTGQEVEQSEWIIRGDPRCTFEVRSEQG